MPITFFYTIADADGDKSVISIPVDFDLAGGADFNYALKYGWDVINPLISGHLLTAGFTFEADISAYTNAAADVLSDVQEKAEFVYRAVGGFLKRISLPTFIETFFTGAGAGKEIDVTQSEVAAFNLAIIGGFKESAIDVAPSQIVTDHGEDIITYVEGHQSWCKNRR